MLGFFGYEGDVDTGAGHGYRNPPTRHFSEWKWQNSYLASLRATGVCPYYAWREPDTSLNFGIAFDQPGIVELNEAV